MLKKRRAVLFALVIVGIGALSVPMFLPSVIWSAPAVPPSIRAPDAKRGAYLFDTSGCAGCHTKRGGAPLAGGVELKTPYGVFVAPNITPHEKTGIGRWTETDFLRAMRIGVSPAGRHYFPSFPYTSYTNFMVRDLRDLWAYMRTVKPISAASKLHRLGFPWSFRPGIGLWKLIWFRQGPFKNRPDKSEVWNRGAYLVLGATHCAECHTPRNFVGALNRDEWLAGSAHGPDGNPVPNITPHAKGIGAWSVQDMAFFLKSGMLPSGDATGGEMGKVIEHTSKLTDDDLVAIADYLRTIPPIPGRSKAGTAAKK